MAEHHPLRGLEDGNYTSNWNQLNKSAEKLAKQSPCADLPNLDHATMNDFDKVYEPSDDTYLLVDGMLADVSANDQRDSIQTIMEIGSGSGVPIVFLSKLLPQAHPMAIDINPDALDLTKRTALANNVDNIQMIQSDLASSLLPEWKHKMDVVIFNPPYVPTPDDEVQGDGIEVSWAGGLRGRRVIDRAIPQIADLLSRPHGVCYMITVDDNEPEEMARLFREVGCDMVPFVRRRARNEYLTVQKVTVSQR
eukprot:Nitzschia sp. Nitz4//scaffold41_size133979//39647//40399//NITZ4_003337-RA/size133979-processed-gene-0.242-mRNA-1//-1//CDS//3329551440//8039//frame0